MLIDEMVNAAMAEFKQTMADFCANEDLSELTPEAAEHMSGALQASLARAGVAGYRAFLLS